MREVKKQNVKRLSDAQILSEKKVKFGSIDNKQFDSAIIKDMHDYDTNIKMAKRWEYPTS